MSDSWRLSPTLIKNLLSYLDVIQAAESGQFFVRMKEHSATMPKQCFAIRDTRCTTLAADLQTRSSA
jgi:hypothetical protein